MNRMDIVLCFINCMNFGFDANFSQYPREDVLNYFNEDIRSQCLEWPTCRMSRPYLPNRILTGSTLNLIVYSSRSYSAK